MRLINTALPPLLPTPLLILFSIQLTKHQTGFNDILPLSINIFPNLLLQFTKNDYFQVAEGSFGALFQTETQRTISKTISKTAIKYCQDAMKQKNKKYA